MDSISFFSALGLQPVLMSCTTIQEKTSPPPPATRSAFMYNKQMFPVAKNVRPYPRSKNQYDSNWCHKYCFNEKQKAEQRLNLKTGLNKQSRALLQSCRPLSVVISPLISPSPSPASGLSVHPTYPGKFTCPKCTKTYSIYSSLIRHQQIHTAAIYTCGKCFKTYLNQAALRMHQFTHEMKHQCKICGKIFSRTWLLNTHTRIHTGEKPYKCLICHKAFSDNSNLRAHVSHLHTT